MVGVTAEPIEFRSTTSRVLAVVIMGGAGLAGVALALTEGAAGVVPTLPVLALIAGFGWAAYARPAVIVHEHGITVVGVVATVDVPWSSIRMIDTRWALTLRTDSGDVTAWAAPAPGRHSLYRVTRAENQHLAPDAYLAGTIRPGDSLSSDSGQAAEIARRGWDHWRQLAGDAEVSVEPVTRRWHVVTIAVGAALVALSAVALA